MSMGQCLNDEVMMHMAWDMMGWDGHVVKRSPGGSSAVYDQGGMHVCMSGMIEHRHVEMVMLLLGR